MTRIVFRDFDEFADAINGLAGRFVPTARSETDWWVQRVPVGRVPIQQVQIGGASTFAGNGTSGTLTLGIPITTPQQISIDGQSLENNSLIVIKETQLFTFAARQSTLWAGITIPVDHPLLSPGLPRMLSATQAGGAATHVRSALQAMQMAKALVSRICADSDRDAELVRAVAEMAMEEEVIMVASRVLERSSGAPEVHFGRRRIPRENIIGRVLSIIEASEGQPLLIQDFCRATRVSERTLRSIFHEYFGVGPMRLVKVRQLHEVHRALATAESGIQNVSNIAAHFGVWDLDSFTRNYVALYGETPAATLRRAAPMRDRTRKLSATWIRYASRKFRRS